MVGAKNHYRTNGNILNCIRHTTTEYFIIMHKLRDNKFVKMER